MSSSQGSESSSRLAVRVRYKRTKRSCLSDSSGINPLFLFVDMIKNLKDKEMEFFMSFMKKNNISHI